ncbi:hypothetical protein [Leptospira biflexa]|uniref:hypothetical protein n=1 Tax=Leptospira biflexa TaxID=172 RepID=UPI0010835F8A|nr:hypothetical protein [Leptospira biflexa]TGM34028.1 hypothetical protein EHQ89_12500 [Leptospira biflexa]TGM40313.1 hypothetical protein EHQ80_03835 [Leptospira biflexa]
MKYLVVVLFLLGSLVYCNDKSDLNESGENTHPTTMSDGRPTFKDIKADVNISPEVKIDYNINFNDLSDFEIEKLFRDLNYYKDNKQNTKIVIGGISKMIAFANEFQEHNFGLTIYRENSQFKYEVDMSYIGGGDQIHSYGLIKNIKCSHYSVVIKRCKMYLKNTLDERSPLPMDWLILTVKDDALFTLEDSSHNSMIGYLLLNEKLRLQYLANFKKALKVAVSEPGIGFQHAQIQNFSIDELDELTDGLASKVKAER